ncbi:type I-E CRISPR-associated protein Cse2/CasB [Streptomyces sp. NPDC003077]|uniref:type I-E CRISPR-associated protein Cse2/CasB n=1 Tax=Streptomyces sp. NPDC003077 TaxID=3154443 RepID=UPI0033B4A763
MTDALPPDIPSNGPELLTDWLVSLVRNRRYGDLANLRRPSAPTRTLMEAGSYAPTGADREVYEYVAFLFAIYHRGVQRPTRGHGSFGAAARRIGGPAGRGPDDPGAVRLFDLIVSSRRIPRRHLQHAVARLRAGEQQPPSWAGLVEDLGRWNDRTARIAYRWAVDFHEPRSNRGKTSQKGSST